MQYQFDECEHIFCLHLSLLLLAWNMIQVLMREENEYEQEPPCDHEVEKSMQRVISQKERSVQRWSQQAPIALLLSSLSTRFLFLEEIKTEFFFFLFCFLQPSMILANTLTQMIKKYLSIYIFTEVHLYVSSLIFSMSWLFTDGLSLWIWLPLWRFQVYILLTKHSAENELHFFII